MGGMKEENRDFFLKMVKKLAIGDLEEFRKINIYDGVAIISLKKRTLILICMERMMFVG